MVVLDILNVVLSYSKKKGEYLYDLLVIPPTWRLFSGTCVCVCFFFRKSCFRFRSFARARADSRRFSRADLILQGGASCAADADGGREGRGSLIRQVMG